MSLVEESAGRAPADRTSIPRHMCKNRLKIEKNKNQLVPEILENTPFIPKTGTEKFNRTKLRQPTALPNKGNKKFCRNFFFPFSFLSFPPLCFRVTNGH